MLFFGKQKSTKLLQIFAFQKIASGIDAKALKCSSASIPDAIGPDCWTHYMNYLNFFKVYYNDNKPLNEYKLGDINIKLTKAKSFSYLLKKNKEYEEGFKMILKMDYLDKIDFDNKIDEMKFDNFRLI